MVVQCPRRLYYALALTLALLLIHLVVNCLAQHPFIIAYGINYKTLLFSHKTLNPVVIGSSIRLSLESVKFLQFILTFTHFRSRLEGLA